MPHKIVTRCGNRCDICLLYHKNEQLEGARDVLGSELAIKHNIEINRESLICRGCLDESSEGMLFDDCPVRKCVIEKGIEHCAQCDDYTCSLLESHLITRAEIEEKFGHLNDRAISLYVEAFENKKRLSQLRKNHELSPRMKNRHLIPDEETMERFIGNSTLHFWEEIIRVIEYRGCLKKGVFYQLDDQSWALQYSQGNRPVVTFIPERKSFTIIFTLGIIDLERLKSHLDRLSPYTVYLIENNPLLPEGESISIKIDDERHWLDAKILTDLKFNKHKKAEVT